MTRRDGAGDPDPFATEPGSPTETELLGRHRTALEELRGELRTPRDREDAALFLVDLFGVERARVEEFFDPGASANSLAVARPREDDPAFRGRIRRETEVFRILLERLRRPAESRS